MSETSTPASLITWWKGDLVRSSRSSVNFWNSDLVSLRCRWSGPSAVAVMKGRLISVSGTDDSSILAFSAASLSRCSAIRSLPRSTPVSFLNPVTSHSITLSSQSSPPRWVSPEVAFTSNTPSPISSSETSKVPPPEVEDEDGVIRGLFVQPVGQRGGGGLVDDAQHVEAGDLAGFLGRLALGVVEVGGDRDYGVRHGVAEVRLGVPLQLLQDAGGDLLGGVRLPVRLGLPVGPHLTLHRADGPIWVGDRLTLGHLAHENLAVLEGDNRRGDSRTLCVGDDGGLATLQHGDDAVGGPKIDAYGPGHVCPAPPMFSAFVHYNLSAPL